MSADPLPTSFYDRPAAAVARGLLGCVLVSEISGRRTAGRIVDVEAYVASDDPANHANRGQTRRNAAMFGPPGHAYVYLIYGVHYCFNAVCGPAGVGEAVLIRAIEPIEGLEVMADRRGVTGVALSNGPGKVCEALAITLEHNAIPLTEPPLYILRRTPPPEPIHQTTRVGCPSTPALPLRWYLLGNPFVSS